MSNQTDTNQTMTDQAKVQLQTDSSTVTLVTSIIFNGAITVSVLFAFGIVRRWDKKVYEPRTYLVPKNKRSPKLSSGFLGWLSILKTTDEEIIQRAGLDAYMFLRFFRVFARLFAVFTIIGCAILIPLNAYQQGDERGIDRFTIGNIQTIERLWAHLVITYLFSAAIIYSLYHEYKNFVRLRQEYFTRPENRESVKAKTILVSGIPRELYNKESLKSIFNVFPGGIKHIWLNSDPKDLPKLIEERENLVANLEGVTITLMENYLKHVKQTGGDFENAGQVPKSLRPQHRPLKVPMVGSKVDSLEEYRAEIKTLNEKITKYQNDATKHAPMNSAFIQFNTQTGAQLASTTTIPRLLEIAPNDVIWENLNLSATQRMIRKAISKLVVSALVLLWFIPVTFVASISKLDDLKAKIGFVKTIVDALPNSVVGIIQGVLPAIGLAILMALLPIILRILSRFEGIVSHTKVSISVMSKYFFFLVVNVLLLTTLANGIFSALPLLQTRLPLASTFFITYVLLTFSGAALELCQIGPLVIHFIFKKFLVKTPRQIWTLEKTMASLDWGTTFPPHVLIVCVGLVYSTVAPLILPFVTVHFGLYYLAYLYNFLYVLDQPAESGGLAFRKAVYEVYIGLFIYQLTIIGLMFLKKAYIQGVLSVVLIALTFGIMTATRSLFMHNPSAEFLPADLAGVVDRKRKVIIDQSETNLLLEKDYKNDSHEIDISQATNMQDLDEHAFLHPAFTAKQPVIWLANDKAGIGAEEVRACLKDGVQASTEGASFDYATGRVHVDDKGFPEDRDGNTF
ncbi:841_t:CDS:10 [Ambispora leptoticha]|uniref:841_t:CDS:1 n=1 Tax=Ambispora leptoticha TaxID=144679 RepID=A0A9N8VJP9_9GLOM|nr:841_t:CDS:10 [Ambispora leptoticha]